MSGSDDGSIELWGAVRKKPIHILRNAHALLTDSKKSDLNDSERLPNGNLGNIFSYPLLTFLNMCSISSMILFSFTP